MKIYWKYQWNPNDFDIYERDTKSKTERHIYNPNFPNDSTIEESYSYYNRDSIKRERQEYGSCVVITLISKADVLLEMI